MIEKMMMRMMRILFVGFARLYTRLRGMASWLFDIPGRGKTIM